MVDMPRFDIPQPSNYNPDTLIRWAHEVNDLLKELCDFFKESNQQSGEIEQKLVDAFDKHQDCLVLVDKAMGLLNERVEEHEKSMKLMATALGAMKDWSADIDARLKELE